MTITKTLTSVTTAVALAATALVPMATAANAEPWRDGNRGAYSRNDNGNWNGNRRDFRRGGHRDYSAYRHHRRDNTGKYIALGIGALMLGIMASEAGRY